MSLSDEGFVIEHLLMIADKEGEDVPFVLNSAQRKLDESLSGRDLVPKARQEGISSYVLARLLVRCLRRRNTRAVVISHDQESTQRMLKKVTYYIEHIRSPAPVIKNMSANEVTFPKMDSMFYIGTAGSRKFGRGDTITNLHCSEYAYWPNPQELMKGLLQAVPKTGEIAIESTGNGLNDYYRRCKRAASGQSAWKLHFFPWHTFEEYTLDLSDAETELFMSSLQEDLEEVALSARLTPGQLAWRRMKLEELDYDLGAFKQEYPMTLDECFQMSSTSVFHRVLYQPTDRWQSDPYDHHGWVLEGHPSPEAHYVVGADVSGGVGQDSSVVEVICLETLEQVAEYSNDKIDPEAFASVVMEYGRRFNSAYLVPEANNHGILTVAVIDKMYPHNLIHRNMMKATGVEDKRLHGIGWRTSNRNKPLMIGRLRALLASELTIHSPILRTELSTFIEHENGKLAAADGCHDDTVIALACAAAGINQASLRVPTRRMVDRRRDPFAIDSLIDELSLHRGEYPIRNQTEWS